MLLKVSRTNRFSMTLRSLVRRAQSAASDLGGLSLKLLPEHTAPLWPSSWEPVVLAAPHPCAGEGDAQTNMRKYRAIPRAAG